MSIYRIVCAFQTLFLRGFSPAGQGHWCQRLRPALKKSASSVISNQTLHDTQAEMMEMNVEINQLKVWDGADSQ